MSAHHHHEHGHTLTGVSLSRRLGVASVVTLLFVGAEITIGSLSGSLSLIGDAFHNFTDTLALVLALIAVRLEQRPATRAKSYGYQRAGILAAFVNAGILVALTAFLLVEAVHRLRMPQPVDSTPMLLTAAVALAMNAAITLSLRSAGRDDVNIRGAVLHMMSDAVSSAGIIVAAILIRVTGSARWDPAITIVIAVLIIWSSWGILRETMNLLLEGTPSGIDPEAVTRSLSAIEGVHGVHHLHIWALGPSRPALSCHLMVGDIPLRSTTTLLERVNSVLAHEYHIVHATVQFEFANCPADDPYCIPYTLTASE